MPILDLYEHGEQRSNLAHFATLASLAAVDGVVNEKEKAILEKFAFQLNITEKEYKEVMKKENKYPIETPHSSEQRLKRLFDFFRMVFADNQIEEEQMILIEKYAIGLGYSPEGAKELIKKSFDIFSGKINFEAYQYLLDH
ncbi:TerB family tellurite resistance protein [Flagellimonas allohymeniacidonis]|uniref:TerB family tellurite resistance protein n=1 Tax=Flagellimonas allohymeniacidonis TaxID=2517819 RepID=A0A4Q8QFC9_9FLAO|nr:TerB family tellurite resistance protein [Allomuricauda hymeniacidonis]TAI47243.1 TerB family tellurite resistance protein [Allomuricauda hymeniacidonis]